MIESTQGCIGVPGQDAALPIHASDTNRLASALREWSNLLGSDFVKYDKAILDDYAETTLPEGVRAEAVLRPNSTQEVCELVKIAAKHRVPIYPISCGKNWGYGDACPVAQGQVIVELSRMDRIIEVNRDLAYAVIEPGVTQGQLATFLKESESGLMLDVTGAGPEASIVGNTLERGFGHTPYGDHFAHSCGMEVVLADGSTLNTGFGAFENAKAKHVFPWGLGPSLDGLFTQSNFGVVTKLCLHLMPVSPYVEAFAMRIHDVDQLGEVVERLRELRLSETVRSTVHIANDLRVLSTRDRFRAEIATAAAPLPEPLRASLRKRAGLGSWNIFGGLYGPRELRHGLRTVVKKTLREVGSVVFFDRRKLNLMKTVSGFLQSAGVHSTLGEVVQNASAAFDLLEGIPTPEHLKGVAWRTNGPCNNVTSANIRQHGLMWVSPVLPMTRDATQEVTTIIEETLHRYKFDALMTLSAVTPRAMCCVTSIHFDKTAPEDMHRAANCYDKLVELLFPAGYLPYRSGIHAMEDLTSCAPEYWHTVLRLSRSLDPRGIISPKRYSR